MTAVEYRQAPDRVQLRPIRAPFKAGQRGWGGRPTQRPVRRPHLLGHSLPAPPAPQRHVRLALVLARDRGHRLR
jgi:hypothetical protein